MTKSDCDPQNGTDPFPGHGAQGRGKTDSPPFADSGRMRNRHRVGVVEAGA